MKWMREERQEKERRNELKEKGKDKRREWKIGIDIHDIQ